RSVGNVEHPMLRIPSDADRKNRVSLLVIASNRGLAGAYNGSVLRTATAFMREQEAAGNKVDLYVAGKKGVTYFNFQGRPITQRYDQFADLPRYSDAEDVATHF